MTTLEYFVIVADDGYQPPEGWEVAASQAVELLDVDATAYLVENTAVLDAAEQMDALAIEHKSWLR